MARKSAPATPAPAAPTGAGRTAEWVPGHWPRTWESFSDEELANMGLTRPTQSLEAQEQDRG